MIFLPGMHLHAYHQSAACSAGMRLGTASILSPAALVQMALHAVHVPWRAMMLQCRLAAVTQTAAQVHAAQCCV